MTWFLTVIVGSLVTLAKAAPPGGFYATKYDHINVDTILNTRRLVNYYADCLTNKGPCTPQGTEFKRILPEALRTNCARCTEKQRVVALRSIKRLRKEYPKVWERLSELWDPTGEYIRRFEQSFDNRNQPVETTTLVAVDSRFDSSNVEVSNTTDSSKPYPPPVVITTTNRPIYSTPSSTLPPTTFNTVTPAAVTVKSTTIAVPQPTQTNKPQLPPFIGTYGVNIIPGNTVSVNANVQVKGLVRRLGSIGSKVIEAGTRIAGMLISTVQTVVGH